MQQTKRGVRSRFSRNTIETGKFSNRAFAMLGLFCAISISSVAVAQSGTTWGANSTARIQAISNLKNAVTSPSGQTPRIATSKGDGTVIFLSAPPSSPMPVATATRSFLPAADLAQAFVSENANLFHENDSKIGFSVVRQQSSGPRTYVRMKQTYGGLPVFGAGSIVQVSDAAQGVEAVTADIMAVPSSVEANQLQLSPGKTADQARAEALAEWQTRHPDVALKATAGELLVYSPSVVGLSGDAELVWKFVISGVEGGKVADVVLWNAHKNSLAFTYPLLHNAMVREIYDANHSDADPGTLVLTESQTSTNIQDAKFAFGYFKNTYDFYFNEHGRDAIDSVGSTISATVRYCDGSCPLQNAFWDGDLQRMYFGAGYASADDVVGHELTHGVTQATSGLIYFGESGAINESFSDIWGEFIDLTNGLGNDSPQVRWLCGEDLPIGAIRSLKDPALFQNADRMGSPYWISDLLDNAGVHFNSGVGNKLAYLLTDGGTFNGQTVTPFGISKTAKLFYEVQSNLLTESSDYLQLYLTLGLAASNLGYTESEKANLEAACRAVEIHEPGPIPINDNLADALELEYSVKTTTASGITMTGTGATTGTNSRATVEPDESTYISVFDFDTTDSIITMGENSVWWKYRALGAGTVIIDTLGSSFDTAIVAYKGTSYDNLTTVAESNDLNNSLTSRVSFNVKPGEEFRIQITGIIEIFRTKVMDEEEEGGGELAAGRNGAVEEFLIYSYSSGMIKLSIQAPVLMPPTNDDFTSATQLNAISGTAGSFNFSATKQPAEVLPDGADGRSIWWKYTAFADGQLSLNTAGSDFDTVLNVYTGSSLGSLTNVASNNDISIIDDKSSLSLSVAQGNTYYIVVDGHNGAFGTANLNYSGPTPAPPPNDKLADAIQLSGQSGTATGTNVSATKEPQEPSHASVQGGKSVWWKYTASASGTMTVDTQNSSYNTVLGVYTLPEGGSGVDVLIPVASNNDSGDAGATWSRVSFAAQNNTTYYIAIDGYYGASGSIALNFTGPTGGGGDGGDGEDPIGADLLATDADFSTKKGALKGKFIIENIGTAKSGKTTGNVYYSVDGSMEGAILVDTFKIGKMKINKPKTVKVKAKNKSINWSNATIIVVLDPDNKVTESVEDNNTLTFGRLP